MNRRVIVALVVLLAGCGGDVPRAGDALREVPSAGQFMPYMPGRTRTDGIVTLHNVSDEPLTITSVVSIGGAPALRYLGARVAGPTRPEGLGFGFRSYPPARLAGTTEPAIGTVVRPDRVVRGNGYQLLLGYRYAADSFGVRRAVRVEYRQGSEDYQQTFPVSVVVCPSTMTDRACERRAWREIPS